MENSRGRKPRSTGLRWKALFALSVVLLLINASMAYLIYRKATEEYDSGQTVRRHEQWRLLDALMSSGFDRLSVSAFWILRQTLSDDAEAGHPGAQRLAAALQEHGDALAAEWGLAGVHYLVADERSGPLLSWPSGRYFPASDGWLERAAVEKAPHRRLVCVSRCVQAVILPVWRAGRVQGLLVVERPLDDILTAFHQITGAEVALLRRPDPATGRRGRIPDGWDLEVTEATGEEAVIPILEALASRVPPGMVAAGSQRIALGREWYEVSGRPTGPGDGESTLLLLHKVTSQVLAEEEAATGSLLIGLAGFTLSGIVLLMLAGGTVGRIRALHRMLPPMFRSRSPQLRREFASLARAGKMRDELDELVQTLCDISDDVEALRRANGEMEQRLHERDRGLHQAGAIARIVSWCGRPLDGHISMGEAARQINPVLSHVNTWTEFLALVHPEDRLGLIAAWRAGRDGGSLDTEFRLLLGEKEVDIHAVAEFDCTGPEGALRASGVIRDISDIRTLQRTLKRQRDSLEAQVSQRAAELAAERDEAQHLAETRSRFLANMSHEIRTPLNAVLGLSQIGVQESRNRAISNTFEQILEAGEHLMHVVNDVLDIAKLDAGKVVIESRAFDLRKVIRQCSDMLQRQAEAKALSMRIAIAADVPDCIVGDGFRLRQILVNLLGNAVKYTERGSISLEVRRESEMLVFTVQDTGIGIPPAQIDRLFTRFHQCRGPRDGNPQGVGLGLSISQTLAVLMGGRIRASSEPGTGSEFVLHLPMQGARDQSEASSVHQVPTPQPRLDGVRVLVADDVAINRRVLEVLLQAEGAEVAAVSNGREAVLAVLDPYGAGFDVVLMDVEMPQMDGRRATREIREAGCEVPVIGVTAHISAAERRRSLDAGMRDQLLKPIMRKALVKAILACTREKQAARTALAPPNAGCRGSAIASRGRASRAAGDQNTV